MESGRGPAARSLTQKLKASTAATLRLPGAAKSNSVARLWRLVESVTYETAGARRGIRAAISDGFAAAGMGVRDAR